MRYTGKLNPFIKTPLHDEAKCFYIFLQNHFITNITKHHSRKTAMALLLRDVYTD